MMLSQWISSGEQGIIKSRSSSCETLGIYFPSEVSNMVAYERLTMSSLSALLGAVPAEILDKSSLEFVTNHRNTDRIGRRNDMVLDD
jgi:hypothetical protein